MKETLRSYKALAEIPKKAAKALGNTVQFGIDTFVKLGTIIADFIKNIPKHLKTLRKWLDEFFEGLSKATRTFRDDIYTLFEKFGVTIKKVPRQPVLASGVPVPVGDNLYALVKDGKELFRGTKKEIDELAGKLKKLGEADAKKYLDELIKLSKRKRLKVSNIDDLGKLGKNGAPVKLSLVDDLGKKIGELTRNLKQNKLIYSLKLNNSKRNVNLEVSLFEKTNPYNLPVKEGEKILYGDLFIPTKITDEVTGIGKIVLDDSLAFFKNHSNFGKVDGNFGVWLKDDDLYRAYGGESVNLKKFWEAMAKNNNNVELSAFETFTGKWAKDNGFARVLFNRKNIKEDKVIIKFLKD